MVRISSRNWTPAQITRLIALIDGGSSAPVIAITLKRPITAIRAKARTLGKPFLAVASKKSPVVAKPEMNKETAPAASGG